MQYLRIQHLSKTYANGVKALNDVSLDLGPGMFGLLGPNGAGKSSLMKTLAGLQTADQGEIHWNDLDVRQQPRLFKQHLGFLPQGFGVYPKVSAYELLQHLAILKGLTHRASRTEQVLALLEKTNLYAVRHQEAHRFSGGMLQRFGIAQALLGDPKVLIVDEPTAGLDPEERLRFNNLLSEISEERIVILSTHLVEDVRHLCTDMAIMNRGQLIARGKPEAFIQNLEGKLWQRRVAKTELAASQPGLLSMQLVGGTHVAHYYAPSCPGPDYQPLAASLEDVYFHTLNQPAL
ncbi:ABC transporter ATP-binding protein [Siphonobacter curvatus]|uniref:Multidrug ABC transporter ATP-binding protein n=1 Tax=Siphonobacter curvatus TaxID=2094562 RepID=A0A2S7IK41_9BACT|nr:ABC transporter ATP-binding protein [Siphonobacter curvatus]PQA56971.1 multidrug ABC transporter ATP-binding protein [Siphonobacter curvatus]